MFWTKTQNLTLDLKGNQRIKLHSVFSPKVYRKKVSRYLKNLRDKKIDSIKVLFDNKIFIFKTKKYCKHWKRNSTNLMSDFPDFKFFHQNYRFPSDIGGPVTSIIMISELSFYMQNSWAIDALFNGTIPRVPCTPVSLGEHDQNISKYFTFFRDDIWIGSHFYNIYPRIKCLL